MNNGGYSRLSFNSLDNALNSVLNNQVSLPQNSTYFPAMPASGGFDMNLNTPMPQFNPYTPQSTSFSNLLASIYSSSPTGNVPDFWGQISPNSGVNNASGPVQFPSFISQRNIDQIKTLEPQMQKAIVELIKRGHARGIDGIEVDSPFRTHKRQQELYDKSIREGKKGSVAKPGHSRHEFGRAVDLNIDPKKYLKPEQYAELGRIWRDEMGFTYGMDFSAYRERWHFDMRPDIRKFGENNPTLKGIETTWLGKGGKSAIASNAYSNPFGWLNTSYGGGPSFGGFGGFGGGYGGFGSYGGGFGSLLASMFGSNTRFNMGSWNFNNANSGTNFERALSYVLGREGGYSNNPNDSGGKTNYGITHDTYNKWRRNQGLPVQDVKLITKEEVRKIYYGSYWIPSGAANIADPKKARAIFDTAVNLGVGTAKELYQKSGGDLNRFVQLRKQRYIAIVNNKPKNRVFLSRWLQRSDESAFS